MADVDAALSTIKAAPKLTYHKFIIAWRRTATLAREALEGNEAALEKNVGPRIHAALKQLDGFEQFTLNQCKKFLRI